MLPEDAGAAARLVWFTQCYWLIAAQGLTSYSQRGWAVVHQAVQHTQQVVLPEEMTELLPHNTGKRAELEVLQREDVLSLGKKKKPKSVGLHALKTIQ